MIGQDPEDSYDVVCDLSVVKTRSLKEFVQNLEAKVICELFSKLVGLEQSHECECEGMQRQC